MFSSAALYLLGDSSVDCGDNTLFYPIFHHNLSLHPCNGSDSSLLPHFLAEKMGFPYTPPFLTQNGTLQGLLNGLNFGSAQAAIMNVPTGNHPLQSLNQQLRQVFETFQLLELQLSPENAHHFIKSSVFYLSFGKDDYTNLFLRNSSGIRFKYDGHAFAHVLVNEMVRVMRNLYAANVRKIVCMGILPLGCAPRILWERHNTTDIGVGDATRECVGEVNLRVLEYNTMLEERVLKLNSELSEAQIVFWFEEVKMACCGLGPYGGMAGCVDLGLACHDASTHVWWDLYNPTPAVNSLLADSAWFAQPMPNICRPVTVQELATAPNTTAFSLSHVSHVSMLPLSWSYSLIVT
ncbi:GDSL esterase/lipase [Vitis vinifera]|uniref:GDSL esterase/lipase n=1 Tax=Vitis vinifera TaxID=29760 RepID=A0A438FM06_VITVI|nr:GDSL esterase/lipase [Vitis vinifera]